MAKKKVAKRSGRRKYTFKQSDAEGKHLVIVESPTKAKTINKYLGPDYFVMASVGHVRDLPKSAPKGSTRKDHPVPGVDLRKRFQPTYEVLPDKKDTVSNLRKAAKVAEDIWFATDLDREGEAIAWHLAEALKVPEAEAKRVVFNAITKAEIAKAFDKPRGIEMARVDAQQARRILDRIVGYQVSPLLWKKVAGGLSAGRVQSVATRLVVEREREIDAFVPDEYWKVTGFFTPDLDQAAELGAAWAAFFYRDNPDDAPTIKDQNAWLSDRRTLRAELIEVAGKKFKANQREDALAVAQALGFDLRDTRETDDPEAKGPQQHRVRYLGGVTNAPDFRIQSIETKRTRKRPSPPFITSTMQQRASSYLGFGLQRTMRVAQQLYEGIDLKGSRGQTGLITYMRTDSTHLSSEAISAARGYIGSKLGENYLPEKPNFYKSSNKDAQEAHEAIRPTDVTILPSDVRSLLSEEQFKLYDLIWRRFVGCQMVPAEADSTTIRIAAKTKQGGEAVFRATGSTLVFDGHYRITGVPKSDDVILPKLEENQPVAPIDLDPTQHFTSPPARYNEASLQKKLEEEGIGRPSTYAAIIGTIQDRNYVETLTPRDKRLRATDLGMVVTDKLIEAFPKILEVGYTRDLEAQLDAIEQDGRDWRTTLQDFYDPFLEALEQADQNMTHAKAEAEPAPHTCPKCGSDTEYKFGKNGRFLSCTAFNVPPVEVDVNGHPAPEGGWWLHKAKGKARPKIMSDDQQTKLGWVKLTKEQKAQFTELSNAMPEPCGYAAPIDKNGNPQEPELTDVLCPVDGEPMIKRSGRFGPFLASSNYPEVQCIVKLDPKKGHVVLPQTPPLTTDITCPKCEERPLYLRSGKRGLWLACSGFPKCRGRVGFSSQDEDIQKHLEEAWQLWEKDNPRDQIRLADGRVLKDGDDYIPMPLERESA